MGSTLGLLTLGRTRLGSNAGKWMAGVIGAWLATTHAAQCSCINPLPSGADESVDDEEQMRCYWREWDRRMAAVEA